MRLMYIDIMICFSRDEDHNNALLMLMIIIIIIKLIFNIKLNYIYYLHNIILYNSYKNIFID